jgi:hypothetical protein
MSRMHVSATTPSHGHPATFAAPDHRSVTRTRLYAVREDVPFDLWFRDYINYEHNPLEGRAFAIGTHFMGLTMATIKAAKYSYSRVFRKPNCNECWEELKRQWHGATLSARAIRSPDDAIAHFLNFWRKPQNLRDYRHLTFHKLEVESHS